MTRSEGGRCDLAVATAAGGIFQVHDEEDSGQSPCEGGGEHEGRGDGEEVRGGDAGVEGGDDTGEASEAMSRFSSVVFVVVS